MIDFIIQGHILSSEMRQMRTAMPYPAAFIHIVLKRVSNMRAAR
jgi:hypothetical protein